MLSITCRITARCWYWASKEERDADLGEKLKQEWPGIFAWLIEGCLAWQRDGLNPPQAVTSATAEYLADEDSFSHWLNEACERDATKWTALADLFHSWKEWTEAHNVRAGSSKAFSLRLSDAGFGREKHGKRGFIGITLDVDAVDTQGQPIRVKKWWPPH